MNQISAKSAQNSQKGCRVTGCDGFTRSKMVEIFSKEVLENPSPSVTRHQSGVIMGAVVPDEPLEIAEIIVRDTATATDDLSAIAPDVRPDLSQGAAAALLAKYRRHGAALAIETIDGKPALAIEVPATFSPAKSERAFALLEADGLAIYRALEIESGAASSHGGELVI